MRPTSEKEIQSVLNLHGPKRFQHFIKRVVDDETVWGLWRDGWALMADDDGRQVFPLWPAQEYADRCRTDDWSEYEPKAIPLKDLLEDLLVRFEPQNVMAGVFPTPAGKGLTVSPAELRAAIEEELERY
ncbi:MAG TPA: DUF2750 domain-containing protein [Polyangiaceae bacterium]